MRGKQVIGWMAAVVVVLTLLVVLGGYILCKTPQFHQYVLAKIIEQVQSSTGGKVEVERWQLQLYPTVVKLYGITLHGTEGPERRPLLRVDQLTIGVSPRALLQRKLQLTELEVQHPVGSLRIDQEGNSNLPTPPEKTGATSITVWDLAVGHALLSNGEVYCNDQESMFGAELYDLRTKVHFDRPETRYSGSVSYHDGRLHYAHYAPLPHNLDVQFSATPSGASFNPLVYRVGASRISLQGEIRNYTHPEVSAAYDILVHTQDFAAALSPQVTAAGDLRLSGKLQFRNPSNQPLVNAIVLDGTLDGGALEIGSPAGRIELRRLKSAYQLAHGNLVAPRIAADLLNGRLTADVRVEHLDTTPVPKVHASFEHISLAEARQSIRRAEVRRIPLTGTLDGTLDASWAGSANTIRLASQFAVHGAVWDYSVTPAFATPVDGMGHLRYDGPRNSLELWQTKVAIPSTSVILDGQLSQRSNLTVAAVVGDLNRLMRLVASWRNQPTPSPAPLPAVSGSARLDAVVRGSLERPAIGGQLNLQNLEVQGSQWSNAQLTFAANPSQFAIENGSLTNARQGVLYFGAQVGLKNWDYSSSSPITANVTARRISLADLEHLTNRPYPVTGNLSADLIFQGSELEPSGHGSLEVVKASAYDEPVQNVGIQFQAAGNAITAKLKLSLPAGSVAADFNYAPKTKAYQLQLDAPALLLEKLHAVQAKNASLQGTLAVSAKGEGTLDDPQLAATLEIPQLEIRQTPVRGLRARVDLAHHRANFTLGSEVTETHIEAKGTIELSDGYYTEATVNTSKIPLELLLAAYAPTGFAGTTEFQASLKGPLKDRSRMEVHLTVPLLTASYQGVEIANVGPLGANYVNSVVELQPGELHGTATSLRFQGRIPLEGTAPMSVNAQGSVNLALLNMFSAGMKAVGTLGLDVRSSGSIQNPDVQGQIQIENVALSSSAFPLGLQNLNGTLDVTRDKLQVRTLTAQLGGGQVSVGGSIAYRPSLQFNLAFQDRSVRLLYPAGVRSVFDGNLTFTGTSQSSTLGGRLLISSLGLTPDFDLSNFSSQFNGTSLPSTEESFGDRVKLRIALQSKQNLSARTSQLSVEGTVNLQLIGTLSNPVIIGRTDLTSGELFYLSNRYSLQRGFVSFDNPNQTRPVLNVQVTTTVEQYTLTITLTGPIDKLTTSYMSDPPLSTADIISLLIRGQTTTEAAAVGTSTDSILAGPAVSQINTGIQRLVGISSLQISPLLGANPSARIALQQRVTKNFLFTFSTDVSEPGSEQVQGEYQFNPRWSVRVTGDELGGVAVDGRYHTKF